jgi:pimeloyl-ACP methyl ester carboxylesterase
MTADGPSLPARLALTAGPLPAPGTLPDRYPYESIDPVREGFVERDGVHSWYAQFGDRGPWLAFAPVYQIANAHLLRGVVPWLAQHFRVVVGDLRGNGRSDRPTSPEQYSFDHYHADFVAILDRLEVDRVAVVGISAAAMTVLRVAAEQPERVSHLVIAGGFASRLLTTPDAAADARGVLGRMRADWPAYLDEFFGIVFSEPHSTKPYEDGVLRGGAATDGATVAMGLAGWFNADLREHAKRVRCPALVIHGDDDRRVAYANGQQIAALVPGARLLTVGAGGHLMPARDPVAFAIAVRDFVGAAPARSTWVRAMARKRRALFVSSAIGLGHVQRDLAIARELRALEPDLEIDWFTVHPASAYLEREGERLHPITARLANESRHFEAQAGEHDLQAFFALRTMDEVMARNFLVFAELLREEHYDIVIGDEAWEVDYHYHENPELKRQPFVFLTDFVGCLPMEEGNEREAYLCADRNADEIEHVARYPWIRDRAIFVGNAEDVSDLPFGPRPAGHPRLDSAQLRVLRLRAAVRSEAPRRQRRLAGAPRLPARREARRRRGRRHRRRRAAAAPHRRFVPGDEAARPRAADGARRRPARRARDTAGSRRPRRPALRAQPVRAPRVLRLGARPGRPQHVHGAGRDAAAVPELPARAPLRAVHPCQEPPPQLLRRLLGAVSRALDRRARRACAPGDAFDAGLQAGRDRRRGARGARDPRRHGEPIVGDTMTSALRPSFFRDPGSLQGSAGVRRVDLGGARAHLRHRAVLAGALPHRARPGPRPALEGRVPLPLAREVAARDPRRDGVAARG